MHINPASINDCKWLVKQCLLHFKVIQEDKNTLWFHEIFKFQFCTIKSDSMHKLIDNWVREQSMEKPGTTLFNHGVLCKYRSLMGKMTNE